MALTLIANLDPGLQCRNTLNAVIDLVGANHPWTSGSIPYTDSTNDYAQDNANFFWDAAGKLLTTGNGLKIKGTTSGTVILNTKAVAGAWTLTLPDSAGTSGYALTTDGAGVTSWTAAGAGGGTTILSGSGAPALGLGSLGDYYVDEDGNQMYGPKEFITPVGADQIAIPPATTPATTDSATVALGGRFTIAVAGNITALRYFRNATSGQASHTVDVYTTGGSLLASATAASSGSGWKQIALSTPLAVTAGTTIVVGTVFTSTFVRTNGAAFPISNGGDVTLVGSSWGPSSSSFPPNADTANFFLDLVFQATLPATLNWPMAVDGDTVVIGATVGSATAGSVLFAGTAGALAQDNANFFWDDTANALHIGLGGYFVTTHKALYMVPHVNGNNWFEGSGGNTTATGYGNFGTGDGVLSSLTTGNGNVGLGGTSTRASSVPTLHSMSTGEDNLAVGSSAMHFNATGSRNVAIGNAAMWQSVSDSDCVGLGSNSLLTLGGAGAYPASYGTIGIGAAAATSLRYGDNNLIVGSGTAGQFTDGRDNTIIGGGTFGSVYGSCNFNTWIGSNGNYTFFPSLNDTIMINAGRDYPRSGLDRGYTTNLFGAGWIWTFGTGQGNQPVGLHVYKGLDSSPAPVNYERAIFDWNATANVLTIGTQAGGTGTLRLTAITGFAKAGAPAAGDLPSGSFAVIDDTSGGATWLVFNSAGTIRKVQLT